MNTHSGDNEVSQEDVVNSISSASNDRTDKSSAVSLDIPLGTPTLVQRYLTYFLSTGLVGSLLLYLVNFLFKFDIISLIFYVWLTSLVSVVLLNIVSAWWLEPMHYAGAGHKVLRLRNIRIALVLAVSSYLGLVILSLGYGRSLPEAFILFTSFRTLMCLGMWIFSCAMFFGMPSLLRYLWRKSNPALVIINRYFFAKYIQVQEDEAGFFVDESVLDKIYREGVLTNIRSAAIQGLYSRARKLRFLNALILLFVVFVLISAAFFIVFAGQIASKDTSSLDTMQNLRDLISSQEESLTNFERSQADTESIIVRLQDDQKSNEPRVIQKANSDLAAEKIKKENIAKRISRLTDGITKMTNLIDKIEGSIVSDKGDSTNPLSAKSLLIAAGVTRFGVLVIVIYLVQILIGLYRYNAKLMTFYLGQADALLLLGESPDDIGKLAEKLSPHFDFGKTDATLLEKVLEKVESVVKSIKTKESEQKD